MLSDYRYCHFQKSGSHNPIWLPLRTGLRNCCKADSASWIDRCSSWTSAAIRWNGRSQEKPWSLARPAVK